MTRREILRTGLRRLSAVSVGAGIFARCLRAWASTIPESAPPSMAIIIDDIGFSRAALNAFLRLDLPITFAVLPHLKHSAWAAETIADDGREMMLHQPMEPRGSRFDPGPGSVFVHQKADRIAGIVEENLHAVPGVSGVNNHMGSRFTANAEKMRPVVSTIRDHHLFFVDSLTTGASAAYRTAHREDLPALRRDVFLDNDLRPAAIRRQLARLERTAWRTGIAVGIGHPHRATADALSAFFRGRQGATSCLTTAAAMTTLQDRFQLTGWTPPDPVQERGQA